MSVKSRNLLLYMVVDVLGRLSLLTTLLKKITFRHAGLSPIDDQKSGEMNRQLEQFYYTLQLYHADVDHQPKDWLEAFFMLETWLESVDDGSRQVVFLDELPWLDTPRSHFI